MASSVVILHGPSSCGKTTLAHALQAAAPIPYWHLSIDHLRDSGALPMARYKARDFNWQADRSRVFDGFHAMLGAAAASGNALIVEHIFDTPGWLAKLKTIFAAQDVLFVGLRCNPAMLEAREIARGDRARGDALRDHAHVHDGLRYDLVLDGEAPPDRNAQLILEAVVSRARNSSFTAP